MNIHLLISLLVVVGASYIDAVQHGQSKVMKYLAKYGYLKTGRSGSSGSSNIANALRQFQRYAGINETGVIDSGTLVEMSVPRCGRKDIAALKGVVSKWDINHLKYRILTFSDDMSMDNIRRVFKEAFDMWSAVTPLTFQLTRNLDEDMSLGFYRRYHSDGKFDGEGGVLAHASFPPVGTIHFDDDETFTDGHARFINLLWVAAHEIGHAIGLEHSDNRDDIMYAFYGGYEPNLNLRHGDIRRIQQVYGRGGTGGGIRPTPNVPVTRPVYTTRRVYTRRPVTNRPSYCEDQWDDCMLRRGIGECQFPSIKRLCQRTCNEC